LFLFIFVAWRKAVIDAASVAFGGVVWWCWRLNQWVSTDKTGKTKLAPSDQQRQMVYRRGQLR
jgi:hypothetical protein